MEQAALYQQVTQLIGQDELRQAAEMLANHWQNRHAALYQSTLAQVRRLHTLEEKQFKGLISEDNAAVEHARITDALLSISQQLQQNRPQLPEDLQEDSPGPVNRKKWLIAGALPVLIAAFFLLRPLIGNTESGSFNLTLNLQLQDDASPVSGGRIKVILGDYHLQARELNSDGQVIFPEIPVKYLDDSLKVIPVNLAYDVVAQSAVFPQDSRSITVQMKKRAEQILWKGSVLDQQRRAVANAEIDIESGTAVIRTDSLGNFRAWVPLPNSSNVRVRIRIGSIQRYDQRYTLDQDKPATLVINEQ